MLHALVLLAATSADPIVSPEWLQAHLSDPRVQVVYVGDQKDYERAHIPGARVMDHMETVGDNHSLPAPAALARALARAGAADNVHVVLYGDSPMANGWVYMALASIGHGNDVSMLDGGFASWQSEKRPISTTTPPAGKGPLTPRAAPGVVVDASWVRSRIESPSIRLLDVRTTQEWDQGHLPGATLVLWQDLYADPKAQKFKSIEEIRALLTRAGVTGDKEAVTYCMVGMRAGLMYWAAHAAAVPVHVYAGSWHDWERDKANPIVR
jgi:thiosulfate/3-mercaptopyruvate sulfurtransferase